MTSFINLDNVTEPANVTFSSAWTYLPNLSLWLNNANINNKQQGTQLYSSQLSTNSIRVEVQLEINHLILTFIFLDHPFSRRIF